MACRNMENLKIEVKETGRYGKGLFASCDVKKGEIVIDFSGGKIYEAKKASELFDDHAIQFADHKWINTPGIGRFINHSCSPNCGVRGNFEFVAMRRIKKGEELTYDYEMTEDSDWRMECCCGSAACRKIIGAYSSMPQQVREKYKGYIAQWLVEKYKE